MLQSRLLYSFSFMITLCFCETEISKVFLETFSNKNNFNTSNFDRIFPMIKLDEQQWSSNLKRVNGTSKCESIKNFTEVYSKSGIDIGDKKGIDLVNDYIYVKFLRQSCAEVSTKQKNSKFSVTEIWIYGLLTVTFINTFAALGILFMPLVNKSFYNSLMTFMVALAIGSLAGTAILILIPDSMKISEMAVHGGFNKHDYKWKATVVYLGLYLFFITERIFKTILYKDKTTAKDSNNCLIDDKTPDSSNNIALQLNTNTAQDFDGDKKLTEINNIEKTLVRVSKRIDPVAWMIVFGDAMHNFVDGLSIGAAFSYDVMSGVSVSVAIMCEELPHELGDFAVLISSGMTFKEAIFWNSMSAMTCYIGFIIGVIVGEVTSASVWIFAIAGGMFLYISLVDMMNDIISTLDDIRTTKAKKFSTFLLQNLGLWTGYSIILILALFGENIQFGG